MLIVVPSGDVAATVTHPEYLVIVSLTSASPIPNPLRAFPPPSTASEERAKRSKTREGSIPRMPGRDREQ